MPFEVLLLFLFLTSSPSFTSSGVVNVVSTALPPTLLVERPGPYRLHLGLIHDSQERGKQLLRLSTVQLHPAHTMSEILLMVRVSVLDIVRCQITLVQSLPQLAPPRRFLEITTPTTTVYSISSWLSRCRPFE